MPTSQWGRSSVVRVSDAGSRFHCIMLLIVQELFAVAIFALVLALIAFEVLNRTVAALLGAAIIVSFGIVGQEQAATEFVDWNTIGLLAGMMVIVAVLERTGVFEYLAIKSAQWGRARPGRIMVLLALVTAGLSAFLDNVTTVILMVPVTFLIADALRVSPFPFLITQVMASNVGGAATLIGDRSEEHTSELQSRQYLVCRLLL